MQVRHGWSGETRPNGWDKTDVTVDEGDLARILITAGLPVEMSRSLSTTVAYQLLDIEAERLLIAKITRFGYPVEQAQQRLAELNAHRRAVLDKLSEHYAQPQHPANQPN